MKLVAIAAAVALLGVLAVPLALAGTPTLVGTDGPSFTITLTKGGKKVSKLKPGTYIFKIADKSTAPQLPSEGAWDRQEDGGRREDNVTWKLKLKKGKYTFVCDPHKSFMKGSFTVS